MTASLESASAQEISYVMIVWFKGQNALAVQYSLGLTILRSTAAFQFRMIQEASLQINLQKL